MESRAGLMALLLVAALWVGCINNTGVEDEDGPFPDGDPLWFDAVRSPAEAVEVIERVQEADGVRVAEIGRSAEGRPIHSVEIGDGPFVLWIMGRLHGNEPTGMEAILLLMEVLTDDSVILPADAPAILHDFQAHRDLLLDRLTFVFIPVGNPDGAEAYNRGNSMEVDLNRDFFAFSQVETQVIREAFWDHRPDGCLDLHNIGPSENDFEAYGPEGPLLDPALFDLMVKDSWLAVHEIDAAGGHASGFNEDYRAPEPADESPWPEVYHPGTHDFFCTARGAPGWTPEGSIPSGDNGATDPEFAWSASLHAITVAASSFHWAGIYDGVEPLVGKTDTTTDTMNRHEIEVPDTHAGGEGLFQVVYRPIAGYADHSQLPVLFTVTDPDGQTHTGRTPAPYQWTDNVLINDLQPGTYQLQIDSATPVEHELRAYTKPPAAPLASIQRTDTGFQIEADDDAPGPVTIRLTDIAAADAYLQADAEPEPEATYNVNGTIHERSIARWQLTLEPGATTTIEIRGLDDETPGPYRFTAESQDRVYMWHAQQPRVAHS